MPELPAMENFRRSIEKECSTKKVKSVAIKIDRVVRASGKVLTKALTGQALSEVRRHGKYVFVRFGDKKKPNWLAFHCGMTGYFIFPKPGDNKKPLEKAKIILNFTDDNALAFFDPRRFGSVELIKTPEDFISAHDLGPDGLNMKAAEFKRLMLTSKKPLKGFFLDQSFIAGIGNVYGDEIPFQARINPKRAANSLTRGETAKLYSEFQKVLKTAISKKAYLDHWDMLPETWLVHYREEGAACPRCKGEVEAYTVGGRHGFWCPGCQL